MTATVYLNEANAPDAVGPTDNGTDVLITAGNGGATSGNGGNITIQSGHNIGVGDSGLATLRGGVSPSGEGGAARVYGGDGSTGGGAARLVAGVAIDSGTGGAAVVEGGYSLAGNGGAAQVTGGGTDSGNGGGLLLLGGDSFGGDGNGGNITLTPGNKNGSGVVGHLVMTLARIPDFADDSAAAAGNVPVGGVYRTSGALKIRIT